MSLLNLQLLFNDSGTPFAATPTGFELVNKSTRRRFYAGCYQWAQLQFVTAEATPSLRIEFSMDDAVNWTVLIPDTPAAGANILTASEWFEIPPEVLAHDHDLLVTALVAVDPAATINVRQIMLTVR